MRMTSTARRQGSRLAVVDGWPINIATLDDAVARIAKAAGRARNFTVCTLNLDHLVKLRRDADFRAAYSNADFITADGAPVAALARRQGSHVERTTGADLVVPLAQAAAKRKLPVYLFGTTDESLSAAGRHLENKTGGKLEIVGAEAPPAGFDPAGSQADAAIRRIARSGARLCFVALGAPKQELFAARARAQGVKCGFICIGAALDFLAGKTMRAPKFLQRWNLEWFWRLSTNPRQLAGRYFRCALLLAEIVAVNPLLHHLGRAARQDGAPMGPRMGTGAGK